MSILSHEEVLEILSQQAKDGSVTAAVALERALRPSQKAEPEKEPSLESELDRLIRTK